MKKIKELLNKKIVLYIGISLIPLFTVIISSIINGYGIGINRLYPNMSDEISWNGQILSMVDYNAPLGYYGYNGTHANFGTFGPWGIAPLIPYTIFGKIFGWQINSMPIANITFLCLSLLIFCILTKPTIKQCIWIGMIYIFSFITVFYSVISMSEGLRYSLGIILIGLIIYIEKNYKQTGLIRKKMPVKDIIIAILIFLTVLYACNVFLIFAITIPIFVVLYLRKSNMLVKILASIICTALITILSYYMVNNLSSPYVSSTIGNILNVVKTEGIFNGIGYLIKVFITNSSFLSIKEIMKQELVLQIYFAWYYILTLMLIYLTINSFIKKKEDKWYFFIALYLMLGFIFAYFALYTNTSWTLCRGTNTAMIMAFMIICFTGYDRKIEARKLILCMFIISFVNIWGSWKNWITQINENYLTYNSKEFQESKNKISQIIKISPENSEWQNTIAIYGIYNITCSMLPSGVGHNYMVSRNLNENARYVAIVKPQPLELIENLEENNHQIIYDDNYFLILVNKNI